MPTRDRRRARRRSRWIWATTACAVVGALLIGGFAKVGAGSASYHRLVASSLGQQSAVVANESNRSAGGVYQLLGAFGTAGLTRPKLQARLDSLVASTGAAEISVRAAEDPGHEGVAGPKLLLAMEARAQAVALVRQAVDGVLGMAVVPPAGAARPAGSGGGADVVAGVASPTVISASQASALLARAGAMVAVSDQDYGDARQALRRVRATPVLPPSRWGRVGAGLSGRSVGDLVARLSSASLAPVHSVALIGFGITPGSLPSPSGSTMALVPPTTHLTVTAIVGNHGNVPEDRLVVAATLTGGSPGSSASATRTVDLAPGTDKVAVLHPLSVQPGSAYTLTVSLSPPASEAVAGATRTAAIAIAPLAPPTPATTTPAPVTTTTSRPAPRT